MGKYSPIIAATSSTNCITCPAFSRSVSGASVYTCRTGYTGTDSGTCTACAAGKYKSISGSAPCTDCPPNSGSMCFTYQCNQTVHCACNTGYTGEYGLTCSAYAAGQYKSEVGWSECVSCPAGLLSQAGSALCVCVTGQTGADGGACSTYVMGKYKNTTDSAAYSVCPVGTYENTTGSVA